MSGPRLGSRSDFDDDAAVAKPREEIVEEVAEPPRCRVLLYNDDFTPMFFVEHVLQEVFQYSSERAEQLMLKVHYEGVGVVGVYPFEIAETKVMKATLLAQTAGYPLLFEMSEEPKS